MKLKIKGEVQPGPGAKAEEKVLKLIKAEFKDFEGRVYVNEPLPKFRCRPDFVLPCINQEGMLVFIILEVKAAIEAKYNGDNDFSDVLEQVDKYRKAIKGAFKYLNKDVVIEPVAIFPNCLDLNYRLTEHGRDGIKWGNLNHLTLLLKKYRPVPFDHHLAAEVNVIYDYNKYLKDFRIKRLDNKQRSVIKSPFGGAWKIGGLAGTGKTVVLAERFLQDGIGSGRNLIYITQNKNLIKSFQNYIFGILKIKKVEYRVTSTTSDGVTETVELIDGKKTRLNFANFDSFTTRFAAKIVDRVHEAGSKRHYSKCREIYNNRDTDWKERFKLSREYLIRSVESVKVGRGDALRYFDGLYIDEFQDCLVDGTRAKLPLYFVKHAGESDPNLVFTEDILQTYVKFDTLKEIDKSFEDVKAKDLCRYKDLGLPKINGSARSKSLKMIYRTPEFIFKEAMHIIKRGGGLKTKAKSLIESLSFNLPHGKISFIFEKDFHNHAKNSLNHCTPDEIMFINPMQNGIRLPHIPGAPVNKTSTSQSVKSGFINCFHENNVRGLEADYVYVVLTNKLLSNPNYIYTLMCRTQRSLVFVCPSHLDNDLFEKCFGLQKVNSAA